MRGTLPDADSDAASGVAGLILEDLPMNAQLLTAVGVILAAMIVIILRQTANARYGRIRPNRRVAEAYERFEVDSNLVYYISGSEMYPSAIIGIEKSWTLDSDLWKQKDLSPREMKELVQNMMNKAAFRPMSLHGFDILDHHGEKIGNCFSLLDVVTTIEITGEKRVAVYTPPINIYPDS